MAILHAYLYISLYLIKNNPLNNQLDSVPNVYVWAPSSEFVSSSILS